MNRYSFNPGVGCVDLWTVEKDEGPEGDWVDLLNGYSVVDGQEGIDRPIAFAISAATAELIVNALNQKDRLPTTQAAPVWRSTKNDPPPLKEFVWARAWCGVEWWARECWGEYVARNPEKYPSWAPLPDENDGTTPENWK